MKDFLGKVFILGYVGFVVLFYVWNFATLFIPDTLKKVTLVDTPKVEEYLPNKYDKNIVKENKIEQETSIGWEQLIRSIREKREKQEKQGGNQFICNCSKTCGEIYTCEEAQYQLNICGCSKRDRDKDGVACDNMCQ